MSFKSLEDAYKVYKSDRDTYDKCKMNTSEGDIIFYKYSKGVEFKSDEIAIYCVVINDNKRRKGVFTNLLHKIKNDGVRRIIILGVGSNEMINCLGKIDMKFVNRNQDYEWTKE